METRSECLVSRLFSPGPLPEPLLFRDKLDELAVRTVACVTVVCDSSDAVPVAEDVLRDSTDAIVDN
jgi:hypothetical protein